MAVARLLVVVLLESLVALVLAEHDSRGVTTLSSLLGLHLGRGGRRGLYEQ